MRFCAWYPLAQAGDHAPAQEGVLQLRISSGLLDYPRGKSAMVWYGHVPDVRTAALELAARYPNDSLLCRHLIELDPATDLAAYCEKLRGEFVRRFGVPPRFEHR